MAMSLPFVERLRFTQRFVEVSIFGSLLSRRRLCCCCCAFCRRRFVGGCRCRVGGGIAYKANLPVRCGGGSTPILTCFKTMFDNVLTIVWFGSDFCGFG